MFTLNILFTSDFKIDAQILEKLLILKLSLFIYYFFFFYITGEFEQQLNTNKNKFITQFRVPKTESLDDR